MGKHQVRLMQFALRYPNEWHGYGTDQTIVRALKSLVGLGFIELSEISHQFRLKMGWQSNWLKEKVS